MKRRSAPTFALACLFLLPLPALAGLVIEQSSRGEGEAAQMMNGKTRVSVSEAGAKVEMLEMAAENPIMKAGSYMLMRPNDTGMTVVNPADKTWFRFDVGQMMGMAGQVAGQHQQQMRNSSQGDMSTKISDPKVEKLVDEDGGMMLGYPTRHYKFHITYTTTQPMGGSHEMNMVNDSTEEIWATEAIGEAGAAKMLSGGGGDARLVGAEQVGGGVGSRQGPRRRPQADHDHVDEDGRQGNGHGNDVEDDEQVRRQALEDDGRNHQDREEGPAGVDVPRAGRLQRDRHVRR